MQSKTAKKCSECRQKAEYMNDLRRATKFYCENHARKELFEGNIPFLPRISK